MVFFQNLENADVNSAGSFATGWAFRYVPYKIQLTQYIRESQLLNDNNCIKETVKLMKAFFFLRIMFSRQASTDSCDSE